MTGPVIAEWHFLLCLGYTAIKPAASESVEIDHEQKEGIWLVALRGRFDAPSAPEAERTLRTLLEQGMSRVILDLADVEYISSGGLRVIVMLTKALEKINGEMKLSGLSPFVSEVFKITNLAKRYDICHSRDEAFAAFAQAT